MAAAGGRHRTAPWALPPRWALALPPAALPASPGAAAFSGGEPQLRHRPQHRAAGNRTPCMVSVARAPPDQHLGAVSWALRDIGAPGEEQRSPGLPSRGRQTGSTAPKRPSPSPGVPCLSGTLLGSSAGGTAGINRTGLGKKRPWSQISHKMLRPVPLGLDLSPDKLSHFPSFSRGLLYASQRGRVLLSLVINLLLLAAVPFHVLLPNSSHSQNGFSFGLYRAV